MAAAVDGSTPCAKHVPVTCRQGALAGSQVLNATACRVLGMGIALKIVFANPLRAFEPDAATKPMD